MAIDNYIKDPNNGTRSNVIKKDGVNSVPVVTQPYKIHLNKSVFFTSPDYGVDMAQDFSQVDSTENIHNGNDDTYWTASITIGSPSDFDFSSTDYAHTGTQSIDCTPAESGDEFQVLNDVLLSDIDYDRLRGWLYITNNWNSEAGVDIYLYNTNTGTQSSSNIIDLSNYINTSELNQWQKFNIPISSFGIVSDYNAIRFTIRGDDVAPEFYLDDMALESLLSDPAQFSISPSLGKWWYINGIGITIVSDYDSTLTDASMPKIPYNGLLGVSLVNGINYQRQEEGKIIFSIVIKNMIDVISQYNSEITSYGYDGTYTWVKIDTKFETPIILKSEFEDFISLQISDDLSGLEMLRMVAGISEEKRTTSGIYDRNGELRVITY